MIASLRLQSREAASGTTLALDLSDDRVVLCHLAGTGWEAIAEAHPNDSGFSEQIALLRTRASSLDPTDAPVDVWLPQEQILERQYYLEAPGSPGALREALRRIEAETVYRAADLCIALSRPGRDEPTIVLAALRQTVTEARDYARAWGFKPGRISTRGYGPDFLGQGPEFVPTERRSDWQVRPRVVRSLPVAAAAALLAILGLSSVTGPSDSKRQLTDETFYANSVTLVRHASADRNLALDDAAFSSPVRGLAKDLAWPRILIDNGPILPESVAPIAEETRKVALLTPDDAVLSDALHLGHAPRKIAVQRPTRLASPAPAVPAPRTRGAPPEEHAITPEKDSGEVNVASATIDAAPIPRPRPIEIPSERGSSEDLSAAIDAAKGETIPPEAAALSEGDTQAEPESEFLVAKAPLPLPRPRDLAASFPAASAPIAVKRTPIRIAKAAPRQVGRAAAEHGLLLDEASLIGIIDARAGRQALVRLPTGSYVRVRQGDEVEGWRVSAISTESLRLTRNGQRRILLLVSQ